MLALKEMEEVLGKDLLFLIKTSIGPLNGLNLRNIVFHGFISQKEFNPVYTSFLIILMLSLGKHFGKKLQSYGYRKLRDFSSDLGLGLCCLSTGKTISITILTCQKN